MIEYMIDDNKLVQKQPNTKYRRHIKKKYTVIELIIDLKTIKLQLSNNTH